MKIHPKYWTKTHLDMLMAEYPIVHDLKDLAARMGRTRLSIVQKANKLGLKRVHDINEILEAEENRPILNSIEARIAELNKQMETETDTSRLEQLMRQRSVLSAKLEHDDIW